MSETDTIRRGSFRQEIRQVITGVAAPYHEPPAVVRRRRIVVAGFLIIGAVVLGFSLNAPPGTASFYWLTLLLAVVWFTGAFLGRPIHLGRIRWRGRNQRPVITGTAIGLLLGGVFVVGGLIARDIGPIAHLIRQVLEYEHRGNLWLVVIITLINGAAEECFFRGAAYSALRRHYPVLISTVLYVAVTAASGNPMLSFAAIILGTVCALERRATGGVLAPLLTHLVWSLVIVLGLPPIFGL
ncbi:MAG: CPBP family intramembrane metalloprotease [Mycobacteriaceae bacterium]|nr:CPBP family intramembrane metalloprotease [Mycobacteriaceae bacterium]MBV9638321.1 CPBP family intramembrane metalloprotease [Mycobacteriaceae bacterium]